jgi:hypothetical protein
MRTIHAVEIRGCQAARGIASVPRESLPSRQDSINVTSLAKQPDVGAVNDAHACLPLKAR